MLALAGRSRSGDRFYNPPAIRRQLQVQEEQQQVLSDKMKPEKDKQIHEHQGIQRPAPIQWTKSSVESEDCASPTSTIPTPPPSVSSNLASASGVNLSNFTNLDRFLDYTTPLVRAHPLSKTTSMMEWRTPGDMFQSYFVLGDLWESFKEWSTFGAGVPLLLNGSDSVVQYYVPYLSGIQLYVDPNMQNYRTRNTVPGSDPDTSRESKDGNYESRRRQEPSLQGDQSQQDLLEANRQGMEGISISNKMLKGFVSDEGEAASSQAVLAFEYLERDPPYNREPLADKVSALASRFPQLMTYRSCDLSLSSWISVAWYPIYRIPIGPTLQNLDSCFLTFHSLSKPKPVCAAQTESHPREALKLSLPIFGLASYKFKPAVWEPRGADESPKANSLRQAAADWLQLLNVKHPDYSFFTFHNSYQR